MKGIYFNGKLITLPGVYSSVESSMTHPKAESGSKIIAFIGECEGGEPGVVQFFTEPSAAKRVLKGGDLLKACQKAWNPVTKTKEGVKLGGANIIAVIRSNVATKGQSVIYQNTAEVAKIGTAMISSHDGYTGSITTSGTFTGTTNKTIKMVITSAGTSALADAKYNWCYADEENYHLTSPAPLPTTDTEIADGVKVKFGAGNYVLGDMFFIPCTAAVATTDKVFTVFSKDWGEDANHIQHKMEAGTTAGTKKFTMYNTKTDSYEIYDNVGKVFTLKYVGSEAYAAMSIISDGSGKSIRLQTYIGADAATAIVDLDVELNTSVYKTSKALIRFLTGYRNYSVEASNDFNSEITVNDFDFMDKVNIKSAAGNVSAVLVDLQKQLAPRSQMCEVELYNREVCNFVNYDFKNLSGGSNGTSPLSWAEYYAALSRYDVTYNVPLTDDMSLIAECDEHVRYMSEDMGKERRMICGGGINMPVQTAITNAQRLSNDRSQYVYPGMWDYNDKSELTLYPAYILAAQHAGRCAFLPDGEAATHDHYKMSAIENELEPDDIAKLMNGGVVTFELIYSGDIYGTNAVRMVQDINTYIADTDPLYCERAVGITADSLNKDIRATLEELLVGKRTTTATLTTARNKVISILKQRVKDEIVISYRNVSVYKTDGVVWVEYEVAPSEPTNYVLVKSHFYSQDISAEE